MSISKSQFQNAQRNHDHVIFDKWKALAYFWKPTRKKEKQIFVFLNLQIFIFLKRKKMDNII